MTERHDEDALNAAIDAIMAGEPASGADPDTLALSRLASHLRGMPSPEFKSQLAAELIPQGRRLPILGRITLLNRIPRLAAPLALTSAVAIAALAVAAVLMNPFSTSSSPAEAFGTLPVPQSSVAAPIEGGSGAITWQFADYAQLPGSAPAYKLTMPAVTAARTEQIADILGVQGSATQIDDGNGGVGGYSVGAALDCKRECGPAFQFWTSGWFLYNNGSDAGASTAPDDATALAAARQWIEDSGLTNGDAFDLTIQPPPVFPDKPDGVPSEKYTPPFAQVIAQPSGHTQPDNGPMIQVSVAADGSVVNAGGFWAKIVDESDYRLHDVDQLLAELQASEGTFATLKTDYGNVTGADVTKDATAVVANVSLSYQQATPSGDESPDQVYLVPVYTAKVDLQQGGTSVAGFATWIAATGPATN